MQGCTEITCYRQFMDKHEKMEDDANFYEQLLEYFKNTPKGKILEDWNKSAELDNIGPTLEEFLGNIQPTYSEKEVFEILILHAIELCKKDPITLKDFWNKHKK